MDFRAETKVFGFGNSPNAADATMRLSREQRPAQAGGVCHALEWTRTTTGREAHKALNLVHARKMLTGAYESSK